MTVPVDEQVQATAILAVLNTALAPKVAYDLDEVPSPRPNGPYVVVTISWRYGGEARADGYVGTDGGRILTRYVARSVEDARQLRSKVVGALRHGSLTIAGDTVTTSRETSIAIAPDDGYFSGVDAWTFTL